MKSLIAVFGNFNRAAPLRTFTATAKPLAIIRTKRNALTNILFFIRRFDSNLVRHLTLTRRPVAKQRRLVVVIRFTCARRGRKVLQRNGCRSCSKRCHSQVKCLEWNHADKREHDQKCSKTTLQLRKTFLHDSKTSLYMQKFWMARIILTGIHKHLHKNNGLA